MCARHNLTPDFFIHIQFVADCLCNKCFVFFWSATINWSPMYHTFLMLIHSHSWNIWKISSLIRGYMRISFTFIQSIISVNIICQGGICEIGFVLEFTAIWVSSVRDPLVKCTKLGCKVTMYWSNTVGAKDRVKIGIQHMLHNTSAPGNTCSTINIH